MSQSTPLANLTDTQLEAILLTVDGQGREAKRQALAEVRRRAQSSQPQSDTPTP